MSQNLTTVLQHLKGSRVKNIVSSMRKCAKIIYQQKTANQYADSFHLELIIAIEECSLNSDIKYYVVFHYHIYSIYKYFATQ